MEKSFDFGALLQNNQKKHKSKPPQFSSVAHGVQKRLESNIKQRRSSRLTLFDRARDFTTWETPNKKSEIQIKLQHRKQQLEKWKEEKEKKKKEQAALKKKPFIVGVAPAPMTFVGPPPVPRPGTSGRVTRAQAQALESASRQSPRNRNITSQLSPTNRNIVKSFAPDNASFQPPEIRTIGSRKLPTLAPMNGATKSSNKRTKALTFNPVLPNTAKQTRSRTLPIRQAVTDYKKTKPVETRSVKMKLPNKPPPIFNRFAKTIGQSSSSGSDSGVNKKQNKFTQTSIDGNSRTYNKSRKSNGCRKAIVHQSSSGSNMEATTSNKASKTVGYDLSSPEEPIATKSIKRVQTPGHVKYDTRKTRQLIPKTLTLSSSSEKSSSDMESSAQVIRRKSARSSVNTVRRSSDLSGEPKSSRNTDIISISDSVEIENNAGPVEAMTPSRNSLSSRNSDVVFIESGSVEHSVENACAVDKGTPRTSTLNTPSTLAVPRSESNSEQKLRSPKSPLTPEQMERARQYSPNVTLSRGKENATKEQKWKLSVGLLDRDSNNEDEVRPFRVQLDSEVKRMSEMCDTWEKIMEHAPLPEAAQEEVCCAVGQARLLMSKKLEQFRTLVGRCARPDPATGRVTLEDLHGFWDMVNMQIKNVDMRFARLSELRARGWAEERAAAVRPAAAAAARPAPPAAGGKRPARPHANSRLREMIAAARKAQRQAEQAPPALGDQTPDRKCEERTELTPPSSLARPEKTFEAGFFHVRSPVRSPRPRPDAGSATPTGGLRRAVVSSEARKAANASFAMLRASLIGKCDGVSPLKLTPVTPINFDATPGRSILKSAKSAKISPNKSVKVVLFKSDLDSSLVSNVSDEDKAVGTVGEAFVSAIDGVEEFDKDSHADSFVSAMGDKDIAAKNVLVRQDAVDDATHSNDTGRQNISEHATPRVTRRQLKILQNTQADIDTKNETERAAGEVGVNDSAVTEKKRSRKKTAQAEVNELVADDVAVKVPSTKKKSTRRTLTANEETTKTPKTKTPRRTATKQAEENDLEPNENEQVDVNFSCLRRNTRSNRPIVIRNIKLIALANQSEQDSNQEDSQGSYEKTNVLKEKANNVKGTPRKSSGMRKSMRYNAQERV